MQDSRDDGRIYLAWAGFADLDFIEVLMADHRVSFLRIDEASDDTSLFVAYEATIQPICRVRSHHPATSSALTPASVRCRSVLYMAATLDDGFRGQVEALARDDEVGSLVDEHETATVACAGF